MSLFGPTLFPLNPSGSVYAKLRFPIQSAATLLERESCASLLETLQVVLPNSLYTQYYYPAIEQLVNYVQVLPATQTRAFSEIEGLLDYNVARATYLLTTSLSHLYPDQKNFYGLESSSIQAAELYAVFTAGLFKDISLLMHYYEVTLYDEHEQQLTIWRPFEQSMTEVRNAAFLSFRYLDKILELHLLNGCLASTILSNHRNTRPGFVLMAKYPNVLERWLAVLAGDMQRLPPKDLLSLLPFAEKMVIDQRLQKKYPLYAAKKSPVDTNHCMIGERFLAWLQDRVKSKRVAINSADDTGVRRTAEGVLIAREELLRFSELYKVNVETLEKQLEKIMVQYPTSLSERARQSIGFGGVSQVIMGQWLIAHNPALIFSAGQLPPFFISPHLKQTHANSLFNHSHVIK